MSGIDGLYKHAGTTTTWNDHGVLVHRGDRSRFVAWAQIQSVRRRQSSPDDAYIQLILGPDVAHRPAAERYLSIPVRSDADANRLLMTFSWGANGAALTVDDLT